MNDPSKTTGRPKIEVETPFLFSGSDLEAWLRRDIGENTFDLSVTSNQLPHLLNDIPVAEQHVARQLEEEYRKALEFLAKLYRSAYLALEREFEARSDPNEKKEIREIQERLGHRIDELQPLAPRDLPIESRLYGQVFGLQIEPAVIHAIKHGLQVIDIVLKTPIASAVLGATAKQLVDSVAKWVKAHHKVEKIEVRLFGPDGKLIDRRKVD